MEGEKVNFNFKGDEIKLEYLIFVGNKVKLSFEGNRCTFNIKKD